MRVLKFYLGSVVFLIVILSYFNFPAQALPRMSERLKQQREQYIKDQFSPDDAEFIAGLKDAILAQAKMNETTNEIFKIMPSKDDVDKQILGNIHSATAKAFKSAFGGDEVKAAVEFATAFMKTAGPFVSLIYDMAKFTIDVGEIREDIEGAVDLSTSYANYYMTTNNFKIRNNIYPYEFLKYRADGFREVAELADKVEIEELKERFIGDGSFYLGKAKYAEEDVKEFEVDFASRISGSNDWVAKSARTVARAVKNQLILNSQFCREVADRLEEIPTPKWPKMPNFKVHSIEVVPPEGREIKGLRIGDEVTIVAKIENSGEFTTDPSFACLKTCRGTSTRSSACAAFPPNKRIPSLAPGRIYRTEWKYKLDRIDRTIFVVANFGEKAWETGTWDNEKKMSLVLSWLPDLGIEFISVPRRLKVNEEAEIGVRIKNNGNREDFNPKVSLVANGKTVAVKSFGSGKALGIGKESDFTLKWTPKEKGNYDLFCRVERGIANKDELDNKNNEVYKRVEVTLQEYAWEIEKDSLYIMPEKPKIGDEVNIYFTVVNNGSSKSGIRANVFVDNERIKRLMLATAPEGKEKIGLHPNNIVWNATGGTHTVKVELDERKTFGAATAEKKFSVPTLMKGVSGIDLVLDAKDVSHSHDKISAKIYNRGNKTAKGVVVHFTKQPSRSQKISDSLSLIIKEIKPHELKTATMNMVVHNCKLVVEVDKYNSIKEVNENNNKVEQVIGVFLAYEPPRDIRAEAPDLIVSDIVNLDRPLSIDETRPITVLIANLNLVDAKNVKVNYEFMNLALGDITPSHGYMKGHNVFSSVPKEEAVDFVINYKGVYPADYRLTLWVDPDFKIQETDEYNNQLEKYFQVKGELTTEMFFSGKDVDLTIDKEVRVSNAEPFAGIPVNFEITVYNKSNMDVWGADLDMFVDGELVSGEALGTLPAWGWKELSFQHTFTATGNYKVKLMVDAKEAVPEKNERNNAVTTTVKVKPGVFGTGHRDIAVTSLSLSKTSTLQGQPVTVEATVKNIGKDTLNLVLCTIKPQGASPFYVKILPIIDPEQEVTLKTTLPALFAGDHIIEARVDGRNIIQEVNEDNNVKTASLHVEKVTREHLKAQGVNIIVEKIGQGIGAINEWLRGLGKPKPPQ